VPLRCEQFRGVGEFRRHIIFHSSARSQGVSGPLAKGRDLMLEQYFKLRRCRHRDDAPGIGQSRHIRQAADAIPVQRLDAAVAGIHMHIMWRRNSPTPRNCSHRSGTATYPRPTHKKGSRRSVTCTSAARLSMPRRKSTGAGHTSTLTPGGSVIMPGSGSLREPGAGPWHRRHR
jgi:hypothetical protein